MKLIAVEAYQTNYPNPINFKKGACLITGKKDTEYEGWIWVTTTEGIQGWVPVQYLQITEGTDKVIANQDYTARELNTSVGEELTLHYELNGWGWVEKRDGSSGWIPMKTTRIA